MRHLASLVISLASVLSVECATFTQTEDGMEFTVDVSKIGKGEDSQIVPFDFNREYEYEDGSDASLLNKLIAFFLPHINNVFQAVMPDPMGIPLKGTFNVPELDVFGYCKADARVKVDFGTLSGLSGLSIDRMQVLAGSESIRAGWNKDAGCLETFFDAFFDIQVSSKRTFAVTDMLGGIEARVCGYTIDEEISGGIHTFGPKMRGSVNVSGSLFGTEARLNLANLRDALKVGYERIEGFIDQAPPSLNQAIADITGELSRVAKNDILNFMMDDTLMRAVEPTVNARAREGLEGQQIKLELKEAVALNGAFARNFVAQQVQQAVGLDVNDELMAMTNRTKNIIQSTASFLQRLGFSW